MHNTILKNPTSVAWYCSLTVRRFNNIHQAITHVHRLTIDLEYEI